MSHLSRITLNPEILKGKPSIRNMRFGVSDLLDLIASEMSFDDILKDYPYLEMDDIKACLEYASLISKTRSINPLSD